MRILLAEDDPKLLKSLIHIFRNNRYITDGVSNGADAFNYAATGEYDGIVMDIMMPEKDGMMVLRELREQNITTPVLLLTARTEIPPADRRAGRGGRRLSAETFCGCGTYGQSEGNAPQKVKLHPGYPQRRQHCP